MADWATISSLATAAGTLVLAVATFASVRSANRSMELAQRALELGLRPLLMPSRLEDATQKIQWGDHHWAHVDGGCASVEVAENGNIYLAMSVRNAGTGIAVLRAWLVDPHPQPGMTEHRDIDHFRPHIRDLYIPAGDIGFWQAALRDPADEMYPKLLEAVQGHHRFTIDVLYGDTESGRRTISRFSIAPANDSRWLCAAVRHWRLAGDAR
jgi:hypothetical protein